MDLSQIEDSLRSLFQQEQTRIVFWNDPQGEFEDAVAHLRLDGVQVLRLDHTGGLAAKIRLERDDPRGRYLLYSPQEEPDYEQDWLLDIRLYSRNFRADRASILLEELGLTQQGLRPHLNARRKFFDSKERLQRLKALADPADSELDLDRKMLAVVTRADQPELFNILRTLLHSWTESESFDLNEAPPLWEQIEKFELDGPFWTLIGASFGYREDTPSLRNLLIRLLVADYGHGLGIEPSSAFDNLLLPRSGAANAVVCCAQWRDSASKAVSYNQLADAVAGILPLETIAHRLELESLLDVMTFLDVEKLIVQRLLERLTENGAVVDAEGIRAIVRRRQAGHWVSSQSVPEPQRKARHAVYEAIGVAAEFLALKAALPAEGFETADATGFLRAYTENWYRFDQDYRLFCEHADVAAAQGWDALKSLRGQIESAYTTGYLTPLALAWGKFLGGGLLDHWTVKGLPNAYTFYQREVRSQLDEAEGRRVFVIVSDALRFEVAEELSRLLNGQYRFEAELGAQLGVLPSYTALGMASLLPHQRLAYKPNGEVTVDDLPAASLEQRSALLAREEGIAVKADTLMGWRKEEGREALAGKRVVYVYHDEIDARGDKAATEGDTFEAARKAIDELAGLVRHIVNNFNGNHLRITADHGFLFTETAPGDADKSALAEKPPGTVIAKKRYLLGVDLPECAEAWRGETAVTAGAEGGMQFWIPKGVNRFHFSGGARFVHGGAMPQEIVVPVLRIRHVKDKSGRDKTRTRPVTVQVLGVQHKITAQKHRFSLIQMEPVSERVKAATLKVAVYEGSDPVTNIETVNFDSVSDRLDDRQKSVILTLQDRAYDKKTRYHLILRDADTGIEQQSIAVTIDRAIIDDF